MKTGFMLIVCCLWWIVPVNSDALTVEEILLLKQNGVSEETIQMMLQSEIQAQSQQDTLATDRMGVRTITRPNGKSAIIYSTGGDNQYARNEEARRHEEQAWEMLRHIIIDTRKGEIIRPVN
jgi:hypothetical protein